MVTVVMYVNDAGRSSVSNQLADPVVIGTSQMQPAAFSYMHARQFKHMLMTATLQVHVLCSGKASALQGATHSLGMPHGHSHLSEGMVLSVCNVQAAPVRAVGKALRPVEGRDIKWAVP